MSATGCFELDGVAVQRGPARLLDGVTARIEAGRCTAVVGPSGAGKSTLLRLLNRLEEPSAGRILLDGVPIAELDVLRLRRRVALVAQRPTLLADRVVDELRVGCPRLGEDRAAELLLRVGLPPEFARRGTAGLSGGESQRVCLARALAVGPAVLVLDEPTSALDGVSTSVVADLARDHVAAGGTVVMVSHDLAVVRDTATRVLVLEGGRLVEDGRPDAVGYLAAAG